MCLFNPFLNRISKYKIRHLDERINVVKTSPSLIPLIMEFWNLEQWELASYVVTVVALPLAIYVFYWEQRRERQNEEEEIYQKLSEEYVDFSKLLIENSDLQLTSKEISNHNLTPEQLERKKIIFDILISLFERAFILVYEEDMNKQTARMWLSWDDYIRIWCRRKDFLEFLPEMLHGEDPDFVSYIMKITREEKQIKA